MIHAFGCSFTRYQWPTWADLLNQIEPCTNWGRSGVGNKAIFSKVAHGIFTAKIQPGDRVIVQWTGHTRWDKWVGPGDWFQFGNVWNQTPHSPINSDFLQHLWSDDDALINSLLLIQTTARLLQQHSCAYHFVFMNNMRSFTLETGNHKLGPYPDMLDVHWQNFDRLQRSELSMIDWVKQRRHTKPGLLWERGGQVSDDLHPEPWEAYTYAKKELGSILKWRPEQWQELQLIAEEVQLQLEAHNAKDRRVLFDQNKNRLNYYPGSPVYKEGHIRYCYSQEPI
jgi:hypothetical protein